MNQNDPFAGVASAPSDSDPFAGLASAPVPVVDPLTQALYQISSKVTPGAKSGVKAHRLEEIQRTNPSLSTIAPATAQALADRQGIGGRMWGSTKDILTSPFRVAAGLGSALGSIPEGGDAMGEAFMQGMRSPMEAARQVEGQGPEWAQHYLNPRFYASMAEDPLTGVSAVIPVAAGTRLGAALGPMAEGAMGSAISYGRNVLDRLASGTRNPYSETGDQAVADVLPMSLAFAPGAASRLGRGLAEAGQNMFRKMVKPAPMKGGGVEVEGLNQALDAGLLPKLAGWALTPGGAGKRFITKVLPSIGSEYPAVLADADATGRTVNMNDVLRETNDRVAHALESGSEIMDPADAGAAVRWVGRRMLGAPQGAAKVLMHGEAPQGAIMAETERLPSVAHRAKSTLAEQAFSRDPSETTPLYARLLALKHASGGLRTRLGEISPEYADLNARAAPYYAAEDAMIHAANTGGNRQFFSLKTLINPLAALQEMPLISRAAWEAGRGLGRLGGTEAAMPAFYAPIGAASGN